MAWHPGENTWKYGLLMFFFGIVIFWRIIFTAEYSMLAYRDSAQQTYPWVQYIAQSLHGGSFPFWDIYADAGHPFGGEMQSGIFYPFNLLLGLVPLNAKGHIPVSVIEGFLILHCILASYLLYLLGRQLGIRPFSACVAALVFAYSGSIGMRAFGAASLLYASVWVPAVFLFFAKSLQATKRSRRILHANLAGLSLALCLLAGHHQPVMYASLAILAIGLALWFSRSLRKTLGAHIARLNKGQKGPMSAATPAALRPRVLAVTGLIFLFALAYGSTQLFVSLEYAPEAYRWTKSELPSTQKIPYSISGEENFFPPKGIIQAVFPYMSGGAGSKQHPYLGILALFFILYSVIGIKRSKLVGGAWLLALFFIGLSLGRYSPLHGLFYALIPGFDTGRVAARILLLAHIPLSLLAGFGCQAFLAPMVKDSRAIKYRLFQAFAAFSIFMTAVVFAGYFYRVQVIYEPASYAYPFFACLLMLAATGLGLYRFLPISKKALFLKVGVVILLLFDCHGFLVPQFKLKSDFDGKANFYPKQYFSRDDVVQFLQAQPGVFRVAFEDETYPRNIGQVFNLETENGRSGVTKLKRFHDFYGSVPRNRVTDLLNVKYIVSKSNLPHREVFTGTRARVYENSSALPRVWSVNRATKADKLDDVYSRIGNPAFDPRREAILEEEPDSFLSQPLGGSEIPGTDDPDTLHFEQLSRNRFRVDREGTSPAFLVVSQTWYPGWTAIVNGTPRPIKRANGVLMGVSVDSGISEVQFTYRPTYFHWALGLTILAAFTLVLAAVGDRYRRW